MPYNSNTLFQKMPDKVSFFYAQMSEKWLELSLKKFPSYIFRNNVESETVLYLTNGRKRGWDKKDPDLTFYYQSNFDVIADWTFCSSFRLQKTPNHPHGAGTTKPRLCLSISYTKTQKSAKRLPL